jgi:hypothetical protein
MEKVVPGDDGDIQRGIADAEMYANGLEPNVLNVGNGVPRLETFKNILENRRNRMQASIDAGYLTVRREIPRLLR